MTKRRLQSPADVSPSQIAYFVNSAIVQTSSLAMI